MKLLSIIYLSFISFCLPAQELVLIDKSGQIVINPSELLNLEKESNLEQFKESHSIRGLFQALNIRLPLSGNSQFKSDTLIYLSSPSLVVDLYVNSKPIAREDRIYRKVKENKYQELKSKESFLISDFKEGDALLFEDRFPFGNSEILLEGIIISSRARGYLYDDYGDADFCQVDAACPIALNQDPSRSAVRILWVNGSLAGWCSGSLVNNSAHDFKPYLLSAEHCALVNRFVSNNDLNRWVFYFNFKQEFCEGNSPEGVINQDQILGASLRARSNDDGGDFGSDFLLLELNQNVPASFQAYYAGWNRSGIFTSAGECYHHPAGDVQKISIYRQKPSLSSYTGIVENSHLEVFWHENNFGFGTTEGGSSGAALLDQDGLIIGTLTGGESSCQQNEKSDLFGRFAYSWRSNGTAIENQLAPWLDPLNTGTKRLKGRNYSDSSESRILSEISIFPNPIEGRFAKIRGFKNLQDPVRVQVFSVSGPLAKELYLNPFADGSIDLNLEPLKSGLYFLRIIQAETTETKKIWIL